MIRNIEATILSSFLLKDYYDDKEDLFELDEDVFSSEGFKYIARQLNRAIKAGVPTSLILEKLPEILNNSAFALDLDFIHCRAYLNICVVRKYYDELLLLQRKKLAKSIMI